MSDGQWTRLAGHVVARRKELGYDRQVDLVHVSALGMRTLSSIEAGERTQYNRSTLAALEQALDWQSGSVQRILDGNEPIPTDSGVPAEPDPTEPRDYVEREFLRRLNAPPEFRRWLLQLLYEEEARRAEERRRRDPEKPERRRPGEAM